MAKTGRPSKFTQKLADEICEHISNGLSLRKIADLDGMPTKETIRVWLRDKPDFSAQYARARDEQADHYADEIIDIADTEDNPHKARVRIDSRKWVSSKLKPKKYGDHLQIEEESTVTHKFEGMTDEELDQVIEERQNRAD